MYGKGNPYNLFAGKDASKALGMSSLRLEDAISDFSTLPEKEIKVLEDWYSFFKCVYLLAISLRISNPPLGNGTTLLAGLSVCLIWMPVFEVLDESVGIHLFFANVCLYANIDGFKPTRTYFSVVYMRTYNTLRVTGDPANSDA